MDVVGYCRSDAGLNPIKAVIDALRSAEAGRKRVLVVAPSHAHLPGLLSVAQGSSECALPGVRICRANGAERVSFDHGGFIDFRASATMNRQDNSDDIDTTGYDMVYDLRPRERATRDAIDRLIDTRTRLVKGGFGEGAVDAVLLAAARNADII